MDLYAPFMAPFVGQDYGILAQHADFIKPMLYRQTFAPTSPEYVVESLEHVMAPHFDGAVLSWNIMEAPDAHIAVLGE